MFKGGEKARDKKQGAFDPSSLVLLALVLASFGLHMWRIDAKSIWWDESLSLLRARGSVSQILSNRMDLPGSSTVDLHPPLYFLLLHSLMRVSGESDLVLRFPSVAFAALIVPLLYVVGVRLRGPRAGLLAAAFGSFSPFYLWYAQEARMYTMVTALGLASVYFLWRACVEQRRSWSLAFGLAAAAALASHYLFVLVLVCEALLAYFLWPRKRDILDFEGTTEPGRRRRGALFWGVAVLLFVLVPIGYWIGSLALWPKAGRWYVPLEIMLRDAFNSFALGLSVDLGDVWALDIAFFLVYLVGISSLWLKPPRIMPAKTVSSIRRARGAGLVVLVGYIVLPILFMWLYSLFAPIYMGSRYVMMCSPAFYLGLGIGLDALADWKRPLAGLVGLALLAGMGFSVYRYFYAEQYRTKEDYRSAALSIEANERVNDVIIVTAPENVVAFTHYYRGRLPVVPVPSVSLAGRADPARVASELMALTRSYDRLWLVHCRTMFSDPEDLVMKWLDSHTLRLERKVFSSYGSSVTLSAYLPRSPVLSEEEQIILADPVGTFEGKLRLLTYTLRYTDSDGRTCQITGQEARKGLEGSPASAPQAIPSGGVVSVILLWQPLAKLDVYKTSLRLVDAQGLIWAQRDRLPFELLPTSEWPLGAQIRHEADLPIPPGTPQGVYRLQLWLYEEAGGRSLTFCEPTQERPCVELGPVSVGPMRRVYTLREFLPPEAQRLGWNTLFGGKLELLACDLAPLSLKAGQELELHLYWRMRQDISQDHEVVLNWVDTKGKVWHTSYHELMGAKGLRASEMLRGLIRLSAPTGIPPGRYGLHLLVFAPESRRFLWLRRGIVPYVGRDLKLAEVNVE